MSKRSQKVSFFNDPPVFFEAIVSWDDDPTGDLARLGPTTHILDANDVKRLTDQAQAQGQGYTYQDTVRALLSRELAANFRPGWRILRVAGPLSADPQLD